MGERWSANTRSCSATAKPGALAVAALVVVMAACAGPPDERLAFREQPRERQMRAGDLVRYEIPLEAGQYVELVVDQRAVDVAVALHDPAGRPILDTDNLLGEFGPEKVLWIAPREGRYRLELRAPDRLREPGRCAVSMAARRPASPEDRRRTAAAAAFYRAERLRNDGETDRAAAAFTESLQLWSQLGDDFWRALNHFSLGHLITTTLGPRRPQSAPADAIAHFQETIRLAESVPELTPVAHFHIGRLHFDVLYELEGARYHYEESLELFRRLGRRSNEGRALNGLGYTYRSLGEFHRALGLYDEALAIWRDLADSNEEANTLHNRGKCNWALGRYAQALEDLQRALSIWQSAGAQQMMASSLTGIGQVLTDTGRLDEAFERFREALPLRGDNRRGRALVLIEMGEVHARKDQYEPALEALRESLEIFREVGDRRGETAALIKLGRLQSARSPEQAVELFTEAAQLNGSSGARELDAAIHMGMAVARRRSGALEQARTSAEQAIELIETLRTMPESFDLRSSFFATKQGYYDFYVDLLMEIAREQSSPQYEMAALAASERSLARSLLDTLARSGVDLRPQDHRELFERERTVLRRIESLYFQRAALARNSGSPAGIDPVGAALRQQLSELDEIRSSIRARNPNYASFTQPEPLPVQELQSQVLDDDTLLLEYHLGEQRSFLWVVSADSIDSVELPARRELERNAEWVYRLLTVPRQDQTRYSGRLEEALSRLSEELLLPVADHLDKARLLIVAEGALQYVPFAALPSPSRDSTGEPTPLVRDHEVVSAPSASALATLRQRSAELPRAAKGVAVLADPVFGPDDPRVPPAREPARAATSHLRGTGNNHFLRLPFSRLEAENILAQAVSEDNFLALGFDATGEIVSNGSLADYRYVHFATHSVVDDELPELSSLVLSQIDARGGARRDGFLRMHQIYQMRLEAELVTLSACRTAAGERIEGEGLVGWTQGFMYSGAKRVLVSLWSVDDEATAVLMDAFYANLLGRGLPAAAALREAQNAVRANPEWRSPYYWAAFTLQGEFL
jgi:CHAT domain-containing protein/Flp pilus assembly protein TadD